MLPLPRPHRRRSVVPAARQRGGAAGPSTRRRAAQRAAGLPAPPDRRRLRRARLAGHGRTERSGHADRPSGRTGAGARRALRGYKRIHVDRRAQAALRRRLHPEPVLRGRRGRDLGGRRHRQPVHRRRGDGALRRGGRSRRGVPPGPRRGGGDRGQPDRAEPSARRGAPGPAAGRDRHPRRTGDRRADGLRPGRLPHRRRRYRTRRQPSGAAHEGVRLHAGGLRAGCSTRGPGPRPLPASRADGAQPRRRAGGACHRRRRAPGGDGPGPPRTLDAEPRSEHMIKPYTAVGLIPTVRGIRKRKDIKINLEHLSHLVKAAAWLSSLDLPVRLIAFPEGALQGFNDEVLDLDHVQFAREGAIDIPGEETEFLGKIAREYDAFIMAQAKARHPDLQDRFFNVGFIIDPKGKVILKHHKVSPLFPVEHSVCTHDVYDWWIEKYGRTLDAFWPVADTEIGRLGIMMANEGSYPENARALALNGAEVVYRASYPHPATGNEIFEIQSRARALDNNMYIVAPNMGTYYLFPEETTPIDTFGGRSFVINYRGQIVGRQDYGAGSTYVGGVIDIEALRDHRARAQWDNWMKDLRTELYQLLYEQPIYPKNLYLDREPMKHAEYREQVIQKQIDLMHERGIWVKPEHSE